MCDIFNCGPINVHQNASSADRIIVQKQIDLLPSSLIYKLDFNNLHLNIESTEMKRSETYREEVICLNQ